MQKKMLPKLEHKWKRSLKALIHGQVVTSAELQQMPRKLTEKSLSAAPASISAGDYVTVEVFDTMDYDLLAEEVEEA